MLTLVPAVALDPACPPFCSVLFPPLPSSKYRLLPDTEIVPSWRRFPQQNKNFGGLTFAQNASGAWGYKVGGAGSVIPFKSLDIVYVGAITSSGSINVTSKCPNYKKMTAGDFLLDYQSMAVRLWDGKIGGSTINVSKYYDPSTGVLTLSNLSASSSTSYVRCTVGVYAKVK